MKVALAVPPRNPKLETSSPPFGLDCVAGYLKREVPDCNVTLIDGEVDSQVYGKLTIFAFDVIGVTSSTAQAKDAYLIGDFIHASKPATLTVIGGVHASALPEEALKHFDCVVVGEGEKAFAKIVKDLMNGKRTVGIVEGEEVANLSTLPFIDYSLFDVQSYLSCSGDLPGLPRPYMTLVTSRGCTHHCPFCHNSNRSSSLRYFDAERVSEEVLTVHNRFGVDRFYFGDDEFLINTKRLVELKEKFDLKGITEWISFGCQARSKTLTKETVALAKSLGCVLISIGLESGCQRTLDYLKDGTTTLKDHEEALRNCAEAGIVVGGNFIYGTFDQTLDEMRESYEWTKRQHNIGFVGNGVLIPYPGTEVWNKSRELKYLPEAVDYSRFILTSNIDETYIVNQTVPHREFKRFLLNTARMTRLYAKMNLLKNRRKFLAAMWKRPVFYWAWLFHPMEMFNLLRRKTP